MKILYIAPIRLPTEKAHGIQIMETCAALERAGASVELLVTDRKTHINEDPFDYYHISQKFRITRLHTPDTVSYGRLGYLLYALFFAFRAAMYARKSKPDVTYTRDPITFVICSLRGVPALAWEVHTAHPGVPESLVKKALGIIPITKGLADWYRARGIPEDGIHVAPDAVDLRAFANSNRDAARVALRTRLGLPQYSKIALYVGSFGLYAWKGVDVAAEAAKLAQEVTWLFVGGSAEECKNLERQSANIRTLPRARRNEIPPLLVGADVLLLPNKAGDPASERDTSPMKLFEYMASGIPIVASDISSLREVLDSGSAFLVKPSDPISLVEGVRRALKSLDAEKKAQKAKQAAEKYTWDARAKGILSFLRSRKSA